MNKYRIITCLALLMGISAFGQNPKFALFESSPMLVNPAYTGYYPGKIRVSAHASMMSTDVEKNLHTNTSVELRSNYDETDPLPRRYAAVGLNFYRYGHSSTPLSAMFPSLSVAYHTHIDRRRRHGVSAGLQVAYAMGKYDATDIISKRGPLWDGKPDYEISGGGFVPKGASSGDLSSSLNYVDVSVGGLYTYKTREFELEAGLAMYHLFYPATDIFKKDLETKQRHRGVGSLKLGFELNQSKQLLFKSMYWRDGLFWLSQSLDDTTGEYSIGGLKAHFWLGLELINKPLQDKDLILSYGVYTRSIATLMPLIEAAYKKNYILRATYEYPMNSRRFDAYRARRFELALVMYFNPRGKITPFTED